MLKQIWINYLYKKCVFIAFLISFIAPTKSNNLQIKMSFEYQKYKFRGTV